VSGPGGPVPTPPLLDLPLAHLLQSGGDHRLIVDPATGVSPYRVAPQIRDSVPLGSCTASSPSVTAYRAAEKLLSRLQASSNLASESDRVTSSQRERIQKLFRMPQGSKVILTPSGTDVIYLVSLIALRRSERVHHVIVGASELGGGTVLAAQGKAISDSAPFGSTAVGTPLAGLAERCTAEPVYLRRDDGAQIDEQVVEESVSAAVERVPASSAVVLHLVAHSKTGLRAPSADLCERLSARLGDRLLVLVDGAQGRLAPRDIRRALKLGFPVLVTGSKFYSGPPFSSALLLPETLSSDIGPLPPSLSDWFSSDGFPTSWELTRSSLREQANPGLALRWEAALAEIERYHNVPSRHRAGVYHTFAGAVHEVFGPSEVLEIDVPMPPVHRLVTALGAFPSVFCLRIRGNDGFLRKADLSSLHKLLDTDQGSEHPYLAGRFHLGQPVALGPPETTTSAVLRVALGARLVSDLGSTPDAGGLWLRQMLWALRHKVEHIVKQELF